MPRRYVPRFAGSLFAALLLLVPSAARTQARDVQCARSPVYVPYDTKPEVRNRAEVYEKVRQEYEAVPPFFRVGGTASVWVLVGPAGDVECAKLKATSGSDRIDAVALRLAPALRFVPARRGGAPVSVWVAIPFVFQPDTAGAGSRHARARAQAQAKGLGKQRT